MPKENMQSIILKNTKDTIKQTNLAAFKNKVIGFNLEEQLSKLIKQGRNYNMETTIKFFLYRITTMKGYNITPVYIVEKSANTENIKVFIDLFELLKINIIYTDSCFLEVPNLLNKKIIDAFASNNFTYLYFGCSRLLYNFKILKENSSKIIEEYNLKLVLNKLNLTIDNLKELNIYYNFIIQSKDKDLYKLKKILGLIIKYESLDGIYKNYNLTERLPNKKVFQYNKIIKSMNPINKSVKLKVNKLMPDFEKVFDYLNSKKLKTEVIKNELKFYKMTYTN